MRTRDASSGMPGQQQAVLLHQSVDPLGVNGIEAGGSPLALEERGDPPVSIAWPGVHQAPDFGCEFPISGAALGTTLAAFASCSRSIKLEGATPRVSAILFTGYPPQSATATARSVFLPVQDPEPL